MNHLAHALVSGADEELILGSMLGDFVHGRIDTALPLGVQQGLALHRAVDVFTDSHPIIVTTRALFQPPFRRYAGIILDIWFDHLLALDFARWSGESLETYSVDLLDILLRHSDTLPPELRGFLRYMQMHDLPLAYRDEARIVQVLAGVGTRLKRANPLAESMVEIERLRPELQITFEAFFPELVAFGERRRG